MRRLSFVVLALLCLCQPAFTQDAIGIIYGADSGALRRVVVPDNDASLSAHVGTGEALLTVPRKDIKTPADIDAALLKATGKDPTPTPVVILGADDTVEELLLADPIIDKPPEGKRMLVPPAGAIERGDKISGGILVKARPLVTETPVEGEALAKSAGETKP